MPDFREQIDELAALMEEFGLSEARLESDGTVVAFQRKATFRTNADTLTMEVAEPDGEVEVATHEVAAPAVSQGNPITSPMTGIYYGSPSPNSPMFVKEGETISAGQVVGLIEAMKVFNEIPSPLSGVVKKVVAESGQIVQPGDVLLYVG